MLRPATPLTILFFVAFVLLVLATISTPIVQGIPIASFGGVNFGVFGYCTPTTCSKIGIGYTVDAKTVFGDPNDSADFSIPSSTRSSLSAILIVHPVAALLTLICFILAATAHLHSPSHSPRYLLALLILSIPTLLITLLAFLVDLLLFVPHLAWGGWIVLVSTILILASGIVTCAMRRTLVSRKARKKRIADNPEMNGQNFYSSQMVEPTGPRAESPPPLASGGLGNSDALPNFATFADSKSVDVAEDQIPLNRRTPSNKTLPSAPGSRGPAYSDDGASRYDGPGRGGRGGIRGGSLRGGPRGGGYGGRDEYGRPLPPSNAFGPMPPAGFSRTGSAPPRLRDPYADDGRGPPGSRGGRGRGGYPPRGYGRGGPIVRGRGGYGRGGIPTGAMAVGAGASRIPGGRGPPPPSYDNLHPPNRNPGQYEGPGGPAGYGRSPSAPAYGGRGPPPGPPFAPTGFGRPLPGPPSAPGGYVRGPSPGAGAALASGATGGDYGYGTGAPPQPPQQGYGDRSPPHNLPGVPSSVYPETPMIGQAVEMDAVHGSPSFPAGGFPPYQAQLRDSDSDVQGFMNLQQPPKLRDDHISIGSVYSANEPYIPPRAAWQDGAAAHGMPHPSNTAALYPQTSDPVELPEQNKMRNQRSSPQPQAPYHTRKASDNYYEDVAPQFVSPIDDSHHLTQATQQTQSSHTVPPSLMPGISSTPNYPIVEHHGEIIDPAESYDALPEGQRSPASDNSEMTSISQRGVNPNWRPGSTDALGRLEVPQRHAQQQKRDMLLNTNPDFNLNARGGPGGRMPPPAGMGQAF